MALKAKTKFTKAETMAGLLTLLHPVGFARVVMGDKLKQEINASVAAGIPRKFYNHVVITHEQRLMLLDGASYVFWRWRDPDRAKGSRKMLLRTSRKTAKTTFSVELKYMWFSTIHPYGMHSEAMIHAPGEKQLSPVENRLAATIQQSRLMRLLFEGSNQADKIWKWKTGLWWHHRIEGQRVTDAGAGQVGLAVVYMIGDEGAYSRTKPYNERLAVALPDCVEIWCGVPRPGETGPFKRLSDSQWAIWEAGGTPEWSLHRNPPADSKMWDTWDKRYHLAANPRYHSNRAWRDLMGGESWDSTTVITQVLGMEAAGGRSAFPNVVTAPIPFYYKYITPGDMDNIHNIVDSLGIAEMDKIVWGIFCDYGFNPSPLEMIVAYREERIWYEYARLEGHRLDPYLGAKLVATVDQAIPGLASYVVVDVHGQGSGLQSDLVRQKEYAHLDYNRRFTPALFEGYSEDNRIMVHKVCSDPVRQEGESNYFCDTCDRYVNWTDVKPAKVQTKQLLSSDLVEAFNHSSRMLLGTGKPDYDPGAWGLVLAIDDVDAAEEFRDTVAVQSARVIKFVGPGAGEGSDHITDAFRAIAAGERAGQSAGVSIPKAHIAMHNFEFGARRDEDFTGGWMSGWR